MPPVTFPSSPLTEDANALALVHEHGGEFRYCPERGKWLHWDGSRWQWDVPSLLREKAREMARALPGEDKEALSFRRRSLTAAGVTNTLRLASSDPRAIARLAELDADPYALNEATAFAQQIRLDLPDARPDPPEDG